MKKIYFALVVAFATLNLMLLTLNSTAQYTKLYDFIGMPDGKNPSGDLYSDGTFLYGTTSAGGTHGYGSIFKIKPDGTGYVDLFDFAYATNGGAPSGALISDGTFLYGMAKTGGSHGCGTIFKIMPDGTGFLKIFDFNCTSTGSNPLGSLIYDGTFLYGMTWGGGIASSYGTIFKVMPDGTNFSIILNFQGASNGASPAGSLFYDGTFLYGVTNSGGANNLGVVFKIKPDGTGYADLLDFAGASNGSLPQGTLISDGTFLYGMTTFGGANSSGTAFKIKTDGTGYLKLKDFTGFPNGANPWGSFIANAGFLYGMTYNNGAYNGTIFKIKPDGTGYADLYDFMDATNNGASPAGSLIALGNSFYGTTYNGGTNGFGTVFKFDAAVGISELSYLNSHVSVYPNPNQGKFAIEIDYKLATKYELEIYNTVGEKIYSDSKFNVQTSNEVDLSEFQKGIYFIKLYDGENECVKKLIVE